MAPTNKSVAERLKVMVISDYFSPDARSIASDNPRLRLLDCQSGLEEIWFDFDVIILGPCNGLRDMPTPRYLRRRYVDLQKMFLDGNKVLISLLVRPSFLKDHLNELPEGWDDACVPSFMLDLPKEFGIKLLKQPGISPSSYKFNTEMGSVQNFLRSNSTDYILRPEEPESYFSLADFGESNANVAGIQKFEHGTKIYLPFAGPRITAGDIKLLIEVAQVYLLGKEPEYLARKTLRVIGYSGEDELNQEKYENLIKNRKSYDLLLDGLGRGCYLSRKKKVHRVKLRLGEVVALAEVLASPNQPVPMSTRPTHFQIGPEEYYQFATSVGMDKALRSARLKIKAQAYIKRVSFPGMPKHFQFEPGQKRWAIILPLWKST